MSRCGDMAIRNYPRWRLGFVRTANSANGSDVHENPTLKPKMKWIGRPVVEIWPLEIFPRWRRPPSWICSTENSAIRSAVPQNPTLEPNMKWIGRPVAEIWPLEIFPRWRPPPSFLDFSKILGFVLTENSAIRSAVLENPTQNQT